MTQENTKLIAQELGSRLSYGVKIRVNDKIEIVEGINILDNIVEFGTYMACDIDEVKPYLLPMSSMTDEMLEEINTNGFFKYRDTIANVSHLESNGKVSEEIYTYIDIENISFLMEFFYSHHIDFRGLIEKGLAIDATGLGIY